MHYLKNLDLQLFNIINHQLSNRFFDILLPNIRNATTWIPIYIFLVIYFIQTYRKKAWLYIAYIVIVFSLTDAISYQLLKPFFERLRPCQNPILHVRLLLDHCGSSYGFPSNHAANHMGLTISLLLTGIFQSNWTKYLLITWPLLIGFAQIYVGVHYPADIIAGYLTGASISVLVYYTGRRILKKGR